MHDYSDGIVVMHRMSKQKRRPFDDDRYRSLLQGNATVARNPYLLGIIRNAIYIFL